MRFAALAGPRVESPAANGELSGQLHVLHCRRSGPAWRPGSTLVLSAVGFDSAAAARTAHTRGVQASPASRAVLGPRSKQAVSADRAQEITAGTLNDEAKEAEWISAVLKVAVDVLALPSSRTSGVSHRFLYCAEHDRLSWSSHPSTAYMRSWRFSVALITGSMANGCPQARSTGHRLDIVDSTR